VTSNSLAREEGMRLARESGLCLRCECSLMCTANGLGEFEYIRYIKMLRVLYNLSLQEAKARVDKKILCREQS